VLKILKTLNNKTMIDTQRNKNLQPGDPITFIVGTSAFDGVIQEKTNMDAGDISFLIQLSNGTQTRIKHRQLNLLEL
jgi:hypothetical protein